jgi:pilus assembly protein CpaF
MSRRERLRRRRSGAAGNGAGPSLDGGKNGGAPSPVADAPPAPSNGAAPSAKAAFDVEVPIDLGTELLLAAAASRRADGGTALSGRETRTQRTGDVVSSAIAQLKLEMRRRVLDRLDVEALEDVDDPRQLEARVREAAAEVVRASNAPLSASERDEVVEHVISEVAGLGPIEPLFRDPTVTDILVNGPADIHVERAGRLSRVDASFRDDAHLLTVIGRIASRAGQHVDGASPIVDARLPDGSRVNAIIPPLALDGPVLSIRRFGSGLDIEALTAAGALTRRMATLLAGCVHARLNVLISGGTGSGKTTLLDALSAFIPSAERVVTIEDAPELRLRREHVVRLETRPPGADGRGEVVARDLVRNALRMRPNRMIIGELRGVEAADLLQAMNTGCEGSLATIHASSPREALSRLENMVTLAGTGFPPHVLREQIAATIDVIVQVARLPDGGRRVVSITEVTGVEAEAITTEIFAFRRSGVQGGRVVGRFHASGARPRFAERLEAAGVQLPERLFEDTPDADDTSQAGAAGNGGRVASSKDQTPVTSPRDVGAADDRHARAVRQLDATIRGLEAALEQEKRAADLARADVEEMRSQLVAARMDLDTLRDALRAAEYEADEQRELQAALQHRWRSLALAVAGFVEVLDDVVHAGLASADDTMREHASRLGDAGRRLLALFGVSQIADVGGAVDDARHDVVRRIAANGCPPGTVTEVVERGLAYQGQTVRRARVIVAA